MQVLATRIDKVKHGLLPQTINNVFDFNKIVPYNMKRQDIFQSQNIDSVRQGTDSLNYLEPKIWDIVPQIIKNSESLSVFKTKIKQWVPIYCLCRLCRPNIQNVGYI